MLTEEIEDIILDHLPVPVKRQLETTGSMYYVTDAAAAIAKRLSEGVVWSEEGRADISLFKPDVGTEWEPYTFVECDGATLEIQGQIIEEDGQLVNVTVKIVEGAKDGNN